MTNHQFAEHVKRLFIKPSDHVGKLLHGAVGVSKESGELLDAICRNWIYGKPLDEENVLEECGDALFYLVAVLNQMGLTIEDAQRHNIAKLAKRYPTGYTDQAAITRADKEQ